MDRKKLPIGISDYKVLIEEDYYYVDKTDFIRQVIEDGSLITMLPRPRRFGKTLNLSMLRYFFEKTEGNIYRPLFKGKSIEGWKDFEKHQGQYPVIFITLKDCKGDTFEEVLLMLASEMKSEYIRHDYLREHIQQEDNLDQFIRLQNRKATPDELESSIHLLSKLLTNYWGISPLVLFDECDTPIHSAFDNGFYDKMNDFMRNFMSKVFKDNTDIFRGVITCVHWIGNESLFCGLNNIYINTIMEREMSSSFGFTQEDTDRILDDYSIGNLKDEVIEYYNGYLFGDTTIYNPWSVLTYIYNEGIATPYWVNTAGSDLLLLCHLLADGSFQVREGVEVLMQGGSICCRINDYLVLPELLYNTENIWSFMLLGGYLKVSDKKYDDNGLTEYILQIPNLEVRTIFSTIIRSWINKGPVKNDRLERMLKALRLGDIEYFEELLNDFLVNTLSYYDTSGRDPEKVYQAFLLGLLAGMSDFEVSSNREAGFGRYDIMLRPKNGKGQAIIMELKRLRPKETVEKALASALQQIVDKQYAATLRSAGFTDILQMAITFDGKQVWIKTIENS